MTFEKGAIWGFFKVKYEHVIDIIMTNFDSQLFVNFIYISIIHGILEIAKQLSKLIGWVTHHQNVTQYARSTNYICRKPEAFHLSSSEIILDTVFYTYFCIVILWIENLITFDSMVKIWTINFLPCLGLNLQSLIVLLNYKNLYWIKYHIFKIHMNCTDRLQNNMLPWWHFDSTTYGMFSYHGHYHNLRFVHTKYILPDSNPKRMMTWNFSWSQLIWQFEWSYMYQSTTQFFCDCKYVDVLLTVSTAAWNKNPVQRKSCLQKRLVYIHPLEEQICYWVPAKFHLNHILLTRFHLTEVSFWIFYKHLPRLGGIQNNIHTNYIQTKPFIYSLQTNRLSVVYFRIPIIQEH